MAAEYYLSFGAPAGNGKPIKGESQTIKDALEIVNFAFDATQPGSAASGMGSGTGKVVLSDFTFELPMNQASPQLMVACAQGAVYKTGQLVCREAGGKQETYLTVDFKDVIISKYETSGNGEGKPNDKCAFNYAAIQFQYNPQKPDGTVANGTPVAWSQKLNLPQFAT